MAVFDYVIFGLYMCAVLGVGFYHFRRNTDRDDYYVGGRAIKPHHVGLSIVATDVGGGFSIGLGGVGFMMGLAGSWLLFTGLVGAWLSAVLIIPKVKKLDAKHSMMTYPDFLRRRYGPTVALLAALISGIGYLGFTGGQILAGAKLAAGTIFTEAPFGMDPINFSLYVIAVITVLYTVVGGLKAVIYTDTVQWLILLGGLILVTVPATFMQIGGWGALRAELPKEYFNLTNIDSSTFINWMVTIIPIWLIAMTLYQRMYACKDEKDAKKAWYIAGIFEYPIMAFTGVILGMCARVVFPEAEPEMAMPMLIKDVLPIGVTGIVIAAYFSAIMSTADSCLMASSGNFVNDIIERYFCPSISDKGLMRLSQVVTLVIGATAVILAAQSEQVLDAIMTAYGFMVSGLFVPTLGAYFWKRSTGLAAGTGMLGGGITYLLLEFGAIEKLAQRFEWSSWLSLSEKMTALDLDPTCYGIAVSAVLFVVLSLFGPQRQVELSDSDSEDGDAGTAAA
ncbi:Na(+)/glucose symporter [Anaerohalosphaera lusitana]|uniref:Na(+)/glucose symporter n=1 Tax=Anaerohalosphaera lusitana TaxID=1936003 RepID=A0A1U9NH68_9BACT|nr:sodium:solute symporter family protein [Anaerohalosphaera lusitana]AQT67098.1 Na(+)/glucose symporter [Anaerohalosphaera lusitana]